MEGHKEDKKRRQEPFYFTMEGHKEDKKGKIQVKKKHKVSRLVEGALGTVETLDSSEVRQALSEISPNKSRVRPLGRDTIFSSQQSSYVELECGSNPMSEMKETLDTFMATYDKKLKEVGTDADKKLKHALRVQEELFEAKFEKEMASFKASQQDMYSRVIENVKTQRIKLEAEQASLENRLRKVFGLLADSSFNIALRAFFDKFLEAFYIAAGVQHFDTKQKSLWLASPEPQSYVSNGLVMFPFGRRMEVTTTLLETMKNFKRLSSDVSRNTAHTSNPVKVAYCMALDPSLKGYWGIFQHCFLLDPKHMVDLYESNSLDQSYLANFSLNQ
ncbi:hypothetical protein KC19_3G199400 [Ceratodon purpureus]|uniref:Uncharacterized protein n=1 Tax=Ceratodon purpureus TaxID=3225 RepID=A0A8T0ILZ9_CERPU|nr:hypothetical protein KC19_3G199400 [Ceratodon purpureus]